MFVAIGILVAWLSGESSRPIRSFVHDARAARELRQAVQRGEFVAYYQPVVDLATDRVVGWEALCRWLQPARGLIPPAEFIPLAERTGAIIPVGTAILNAATCQAAAWIRAGADDDVVMAVNVSALQLCQPDFVSVVVAALGASGLSPKCLCLEITETAIVHQRTTALTNLTELHEMGVLIALDDFGTGHSTLAYLQDFPIDIIKIDLSFVSHIDHDPKGAALVLAIIQLAKALGVSTVGEGIERAGQLDALGVMGCDLGQGYYLGRPAPPDAMSATLMSAIPHVPPRAGEIPVGGHVLVSSAQNIDLWGRADELERIANQQIEQGKFEAAVGSCEQLLELLGDPRAPGLEVSVCRTLTTKSFALGELGLGEEALEGLNQAHEIADRLQDKTLQYWVLNRLGVVNGALGRREAANLQLSGALALSESLTAETKFAALNNLADWGMAFIQELRAHGETDRASALVPQSLRVANRAMDLARDLNHPFKVAIALLNLGVMRWLAGDSTQALVILAEARQLAAEHGFRSLELSALQYTAPILLAKGDAKGAIEVLEFVLQRWRESDERFAERDSLLLLSNAHAVAGNYRAALLCHQEFYRLEQTIRSERIDIRAHLLTNRLELESARSEMADARARNKQLEEDTRSLKGRTVELEKRVNQDSLTRVGNRRYLDAVLPQLFRTSPLTGRGLHVAMVDLDHFKAVNDTFGHAVGDQVLRRVAQLMVQHSRSDDLLARYGGEEFLLGFTDVDRESASAMCERLRRAIAAEDWSSVREGLSITASIGLAARADATTVSQLVDRADENLYLAKTNGRNRVHPYDPERSYAV
ncbi:MAG: EAL domain-containing protein [Cellulomonas sp.]